jgi:hypothetical protein
MAATPVTAARTRRRRLVVRRERGEALWGKAFMHLWLRG